MHGTTITEKVLVVDVVVPGVFESAVTVQEYVFVGVELVGLAYITNEPLPTIVLSV